jgi:IPT/TIG domain
MSNIGTRARFASVTLASLLLAAVALISTNHSARAAGCMVAQCPSISFLSRSAGPNSGGTLVNVFGSNFQNGAVVHFGGNSVTAVFIDSTQLRTVTPSIAPNGYGSLFVDVKNPDGGTSSEVITFAFYEPLPVIQLTGPAAVSTYGFPSYRIDVFGTGTDNALHHTSRGGFSSPWLAWESLGGTLTSAPTAVSWSPNRIDVFVKGADNGLWHRWWDGAHWNGWEGLGGGLTSAPAVSSWGSGRLDVFVKGTDNALWHRFYAGGWQGWERLGGHLTSAPGASSWGPNRIDVVVRGTDNGLWHGDWDGARWNLWDNPGGPGFALSSGPQVASDLRRDLDVLALGPTGDVGHIAFAGAHGRGWLNWRDEGGYWGTGTWMFGPGTVSLGSGFGAEIVEVAPDGSVWLSEIQAGAVFVTPVSAASHRPQPGTARAA